MSRFEKTHRNSWEEWKRCCAIDLCGSEAKNNLCTYGAQVVSQLWRKCSPDIAPPFDSNQQRWHLFEVHMHTESGKTGKRWKDWLFERAENSSDDFATVLEKMTYVCMRTTVNQLCSNEGHLKAHMARVRLTDWDAPLFKETDSHATFGDNHAGNPWEDPAQTAAWNELREIAQQEAADLFKSLDLAARTSLLADCLGISLDEPAVTKLAGKGKTVLYTRLTKTAKQAGDSLREKYSAEDARTLDLLVALTQESLQEASILWGKSEKLAEPLFIV